MEGPVEREYRSAPLVGKVDCVRFYVPDLDAGLEMPDTDAEIVLQVERRGQETDLKVDSADDAAARVEAAGGKVIVPPFEIQIGRCTVVEDQWGNRMVLVDSTKGTLLTDDEGNVIGTG